MDELHTWHIFVAVLIPTFTVLAGVYRLRITDKDRIADEIRRQERLKHRIDNNESYIKRVEQERKEVDEAHARVHEKIFAKLDEIIARFKDIDVKIAELSRSLEDHRKECEQRKRGNE